tara:strand:+ start:170 stop:517 length:348 start_codon:yes stop_codon:yes gene_type:complete
MNKEKRRQEELDKNMEYYCVDHARERHLDWQKNNKNVKVEVGDHVKVGFPARIPGTNELTKEWMWVKVRSIQNKRIIGYLDNEPVYITTPRREYKDIVITFRDEICDLIKNNENV